jgi:phosphatidylglycerophosphatase C
MHADQIASGQIASTQATAPQRDVAIFDLDGTITDCDTFLHYLVGYFVRSPGRWWRGLFLVGGVLLYSAGRVDNTWLKILFLKNVLGGRSRIDLERWTNRFLTGHVVRRLRPAALAVIEAARRRGDRLILASASPDLYVAALARQLNFDHVVCTNVGWTGSGELMPVLPLGNCYGETKRRRVWAYLDSLKDVGNIAFYTDHHSDLVLLETVNQPIAVNPTPKLKAAALEWKMTILEW